MTDPNDGIRVRVAWVWHAAWICFLLGAAFGWWVHWGPTRWDAEIPASLRDVP